MKVKLLKHIPEGGGLKMARRKGRDIPFVEGAVIEMSEASAEKYIKLGWAEPFREQPQ
jgi:hypothetical protein